MSAPLFFSYVVAVHNEESVLAETVSVLSHKLAAWPGSRVILAENGSSDGSRKIAESLASTRDGVTIETFSAREAGLGYAFEGGLALALERTAGLSDEDRARHWVVFTAADLPFGFSDLDGLLHARELGTTSGIVIGSKAHSMTEMTKSLTRTIATLGYRALRAVVLDMKTGDPQGTFFLHDPEARTLVGRVRARNYFYTTEIVHLAEQDKIPITEVPVRYVGEKRASSVRLLTHGRQMALQLVELRRRTGRSHK